MITRLSLRAKSAILLIAVLVVVTLVFSVLRSLGDSAANLTASSLRVQSFDNTNHDFDEGMLNQETGVRGYALTGDGTYLDPYQVGRAVTAKAKSVLDKSAPQNDREPLRSEEIAAAAWQGWAASRILAVKTGGPGATAADVEGKRLSVPGEPERVSLMI